MAQPRAVGIDLGTTFSAIAWLDDSGRTAMVPNADGEHLTPSAVYFADDKIVVGRNARRRGASALDRLAQFVKRDIGQPLCRRPIRGQHFPPEVLQAYILRALKDDIVRALGSDFRVVITVPAFFDEPRRKATADAGQMAGLELLDIVNEPTAAALAYGERLGYLTAAGDSRAPLKALVYDLGGGTFDVTVVDLRPGDLRTLATDGDVWLGGRDWDERLAHHIADEFATRFANDPRTDDQSFERLVDLAEQAKQRLTTAERTTVEVDFANASGDIEVTRADFEELTADLLERTAHTTREVLSAAQLTWREIDRILLVGGSTRMPAVARMLKELSGIVPDSSVHPDEAVARGAALYAAYQLRLRESPSPAARKLRITDVNSHSLGIEGVDPRTDEPYNAVLIRRNSALPVERTREFITKFDSQPSIVIKVLEGESTMPSACTPIGRAVIANLPAKLPQGWPIKVRFAYGTNGRLSVHAAVPGTDREARLELEREQMLSIGAMGRWHEVVSKARGLNDIERFVAAQLGPAAPSPKVQPTKIERGPPAPAPPADWPRSPLIESEDEETFDFEDIAPAVDSFPSTMEIEISPPEEELPHFDFAIPQATIALGNELAEAPVAAGRAPRPSLSLEAASADFAPSPARARAKAKGSSFLAQLVGHVVFAALGLAIGYYVLCWVNPEGNFLHLSLPGLRAAPQTSDQSAPRR